MQHPSQGLPSQDQVAFDHALSRVIEGMADERDIRLVRESLRSNAGLRKRYIDQMLLDADLVEEFSTESISGMIDVLSMGVQAEAEWTPPASRIVRASETEKARAANRRRGRRRAGAGLLIFALIIALAGWNASRGVAPTPKSIPLATVTGVRYLVTRPGEPIPIAGRALSSGRVAVESGVVEITVRNGVRLVFEGPGELELLGESHAILRSGNLVARMEGTSGRQFQLDTPTIHLQALNAEFAIRAAPGFVVDVQAYRGELVVSRPGGMGETFPRRMTPSQAARFRPVHGGEGESIPYEESRFVREIPPSALSDPNPTGVSIDEGSGSGFDSLTVTRRIAPVRIDGQVDDWSESVGFLATRETGSAGERRVVGRMMYDEQQLYVAAHVRDPAPMRNVLSPGLDADSAWRGGAVQLWISADRRASWPVRANAPGYYAASRAEPSEADKLAARNQRLSQLTLWHHAPDGKACLAVSRGMMGAEPAVNPAGFQGAFAKDPDGAGYLLEYAIPWSLLNAGDDPPKAGDNLAVGWMFRWSDESGRLARDRLAEIRNNEEPASNRFSDRAATWGIAKYR